MWRRNMHPRKVSFLVAVLTLFTQPTFAATLASPEQDRQAKQATPAPGKALVYVYRLNDGDDSEPGIWLNGRASGNLPSRTFGMWAAGSGRLDIRAGAVDAKPLSFTCEAGRVYFVQLSVNQDRGISLRQVAYGVGRTDLQQARLVLDPALAARAAAAPAKPAPRPAPSSAPAPVKQTPRETPKVTKPAPAPRVAEEEEQQQAASGVTLIFKVGSFTLASESQTILGRSRSFSAANLAYGLEGEWRFQNGFAVGVEFFGHSQDYTMVGSPGNGDMNVTSVLFNAKKYFRPISVVQPYLGVGIGTTVTDISGGSSGTAGFSGNSAGFAIQGMAGVAFRWRHVGIYTEFKYERAETEGTDTNTGVTETLDTSGTGLFAGMNVQF